MNFRADFMSVIVYTAAHRPFGICVRELADKHLSCEASAYDENPLLFPAIGTCINSSLLHGGSTVSQADTLQ
jgi:hypothetical protein